MIEAELVFRSLKQVLEWRVVQVRYRHHVPLLPSLLSYINCYMPFRDFMSTMRLDSENVLHVLYQRRQTNYTHIWSTCFQLWSSRWKMDRTCSSFFLVWASWAFASIYRGRSVRKLLPWVCSSKLINKLQCKVPLVRFSLIETHGCSASHWHSHTVQLCVYYI